MRIIAAFIILLICSTIFSCKQGNKSNATSNTAGTGTYDTVALYNYRIYLRSLDTLHAASNTAAAQKYADLFKSANQDTRDSAFSVFKDFYNKLDQTLDNNRDATISYDSLIMDSNGNLPKLSPKLTAYALNLKDNGFKVQLAEGNPFISQDLDFEVKWFYAYLSEPLKQFLTQLDKEEKEGFAEDAALTISPEQLADRTIWWENFAKKYAQTIAGVPSMENWKSYLGVMMAGMDNSQVMDVKNPQNLNPYFKAAYIRVTNNYANSQTAKLVSPYFNFLKSKQAAKAKSLLESYKAKKLIY